MILGDHCPTLPTASQRRTNVSMLSRWVNPLMGRRTDVNSRRIAPQINFVQAFAIISIKTFPYIFRMLFSIVVINYVYNTLLETFKLDGGTKVLVILLSAMNYLQIKKVAASVGPKVNYHMTLSCHQSEKYSL